MATLIPTRNTCLPRMTGGERRFAQRLEDNLEDDYLVWYDVPVGPKQRRPDFVVLHPRRGLLVLEVKDWKIDTIHSLDKYTAQLKTDRGLVKQINPILQARNMLLEVIDALKIDCALVHPESHSHAGKLIFPWGHGVVLTNVTRAAFEVHELGNVLPSHLVLCQDEMAEGTTEEVFQERLWAMFTYVFGNVLTLPQIDRIRWHLFPEIRVKPPLQPDLLVDGSAAGIAPDIVKVMDLQQEQLARSLGDGHRVIHGVAGSGKTMILGYRCLHLARVQGKPILVLCFNRTLAARLGQIIRMHCLEAQVEIRSFHSWCARMLQAFHIASPKSTGNADDFFAAQVDAVIRGVDAGMIPRGQYGAVLVDEGHDFEPHWLRLIVQMVDPASNALLLLYDDAQAIYAKSSRSKFTFASVGIEARGRTTILKLNYRNTWEILTVAKTFAGRALDGDGMDEDAPTLILPESVGRRGPVPKLIRCTSLNAEADSIASLIESAVEERCSLDQIAVVWRHWRHAEVVASALAKRRIAFVWAKDSQTKERLFEGEPSVKLVSMHSSKGLEFERVFIPAIGTLPEQHDDAATEAKLLYVAMTRSTEELVMTHSSDSAFTDRISGALQDLPTHGRAA